MQHSPQLLPKNKLTRLEWVVTVLGSIDPAFASFQAIKIWRLQSAHEIFLGSWLFSTFVAAVWMYYGFRIKKTPILVTSFLWVLVNGSVALGTILYG